MFVNPKTFKGRLGRFKRRLTSVFNKQVSELVNVVYANQRSRDSKTDPPISIAVSTTRQYASKTLPGLLANLQRAGIRPELIHVFEGGHTQKSKLQVEGYHHYLIDNNSFDITALIGILEFDLPQEYWLLLHDTTSVRRSFKNLFAKINPSGFDCMPLRVSPSMNIGVYSKNYLHDKKEYLLDFRNHDYSPEGLLRTKERAFKEEDFLFNATSRKRIINTELARFEYITLVKYFDQYRIMEGYPQLGLLKFKANSPVLVMRDFPEIELPKHDPETLERISWTIDL